MKRKTLELVSGTLFALATFFVVYPASFLMLYQPKEPKCLKR